MIRPAIEDEMRRIGKHYDDIERLRVYLNGKIETVEQMELENLEAHLVLEQKLRSAERNPTTT